MLYVEIGVNLASTGGAAAWSFDLSHWGRCGQGWDESSAIADLGLADTAVAERIHGDEQAFDRDRIPCTAAEREVTLEILSTVRQETVNLVASASPAQLDWEDPDRELPEWARWRTARQLAWHIADTESRYYLPKCGLESRDRLPQLVDELHASGEHVRAAVSAMPAEIVRAADGEVWTSVKLLRRLAWHERGELVVLRQLLAS